MDFSVCGVVFGVVEMVVVVVFVVGLVELVSVLVVVDVGVWVC